MRHCSKDTPRGHAKDAIERMILTRGYGVGDKLPTYRDLAKHYGIAVRTIERVMRQLADSGTVQLLHGKGAFVRKLPASGGQLSEIGLVYPASRVHLVRTDYLNQILTGVIVACDQQNADVQIVSLHSRGGGSTPASPRDICLRVDGVVLLGVLNESYIAQFVQESAPLVLVDAQTRHPVHSVSVDNGAAANLVMDYLYAQGHRRIGYVDAHSTDDLAATSQTRWIESCDNRERADAYLAAVDRLGLGYRQVYKVAGSGPEGLDPVVSMLRSDSQPPTALVTYDNSLARRLCQALPVAGLRIPEDVSVAGLVSSSNDTVAEGRPLTCAVADFQAMGQMAVAALQRQTAGREMFVPGVDRVGCKLNVGATTAPAGRLTQ